jgi:nuclear cap-binding protein subunit 2
MAELFHKEETPQYFMLDAQNYDNGDQQLEALTKSATIYVGNLSFFSKESQIYETFARVGPVKRLIMGLNRETKTPCGFCFVEYFIQDHAHAALKYISDTVCDERIIRCDADPGFIHGRQFGRGKSGGQVRDEWTTNYDPGRGRLVPPEAISGRKRERDDDRRGSGGHKRHGRTVTDYSRRNFKGRQQDGAYLQRQTSDNTHQREMRAAHRHVQEATLSINSGLPSAR